MRKMVLMECWNCKKVTEHSQLRRTVGFHENFPNGLLHVSYKCTVCGVVTQKTYEKCYDGTLIDVEALYNKHFGKNVVMPVHQDRCVLCGKDTLIEFYVTDFQFKRHGICRGCAWAYSRYLEEKGAEA